MYVSHAFKDVQHLIMYVMRAYKAVQCSLAGVYFIRFAACFLVIFALRLLPFHRPVNRPIACSAFRCPDPNAEQFDAAVSVTMVPNSFIVLPNVCARSLLV